MADDNDDDNSATLALVYSPAASAVHDRLPSNLGRSSLVHGLIDALGIIKNRPSAIILRPQPATADQLGVFHSARYLTILNAFAKEQDVPATYLHAAGLEDDCPTFKGLIPHVLLSVGGTLSAIQFALSTRDTPRIALHWDGGRHHAKSSAAGGFCYANDVAIGLHCAISMLSISDHLPGRRLMPRIVYLDLDVHHGDGVEDAVLEMSDGDVLAVSIHHASPGFYPGTGTDAIIDAFEWPGDETPTRAIDIPLARGASDTTVIAAVSMVLTGLQMHSNDSEQPRLVVVQAGADGLAGDPKAMGAWNCSTRAIVHSVALIRAVWPVTNLVVLGGGTPFPSSFPWEAVWLTI
ncbi:hypothetical protein BC828DRAFT_374452 [Blastocladiella britannica]|nr:hypothetical protein BC828DRAFT_374452 [Blastocladiella britannica]